MFCGRRRVSRALARQRRERSRDAPVEVRSCFRVVTHEREERHRRRRRHGPTGPRRRLALEDRVELAVLAPLLGRRRRADDGEGLWRDGLSRRSRATKRERERERKTHRVGRDGREPAADEEQVLEPCRHGHPAAPKDSSRAALDLEVRLERGKAVSARGEEVSAASLGRAEARDGRDAPQKPCDGVRDRPQGERPLGEVLLAGSVAWRDGRAPERVDGAEQDDEEGQAAEGAEKEVVRDDVPVEEGRQPGRRGRTRAAS